MFCKKFLISSASDVSNSYSMQCDIFGQSAELSVTPLTLQRHLLLDTPDTSQLELRSLQLTHEDGECLPLNWKILREKLHKQ